MPVNEASFYSNDFPTLIQQLQDMVAKERCQLVYGPATSCRQECHMSEDPDRGCISVTVGLKYNPLYCAMTKQELKHKIENKVYAKFSSIFRH